MLKATLDKSRTQPSQTLLCSPEAQRLFVCHAPLTPASHLGLQVLHGLLKGFGGRPLVVAQDGYSPVGAVVGEDLGRDVLVG